MTDVRAPVPEHVHLIRALVSLALDYLRWTQLVPMLFAWTFLLLLVAALLVTNFQQASFSLIERGFVFYEEVFGPIEPPPPDPDRTTAPGATPSADPGSASDAAAEPATIDDPAGSEGVRFSDDDIMPVVLRAWALLALVGWLFGVLRAMLFGPREPSRLWPRLRIAAYCAVGCSGLMWTAYLLGSETFNGGPLGWALLFTGVPFGVWVVSVWSLAVGHLIGRIQRYLHS